MTKKNRNSIIRDISRKYAKERIPFNHDRGRSVVYIRKEEQTVKLMFLSPSTCDHCDNGGIGHVQKIGKTMFCDSCLAALVRTRILNGGL